MDLFKDIRPVDYLLTAALAVGAALIGLENVNAGADADVAHALDSHSAAIVPVFVLAALPVLWRRRNILVAIAASTAVLAVSLPAFGWITRCGFALPLTFVLAYAVARYAGSRQNHLIGLAGLGVLQAIALVMDSSTGGLGALGLSLPLTAVFYGIGLFVQNRTNKQDAPVPTTARVHV